MDSKMNKREVVKSLAGIDIPEEYCDYEWTIQGDKIYYQWSEKSDRKVDEWFSWNGVFDVSATLEYESTSGYVKPVFNNIPQNPLSVRRKYYGNIIDRFDLNKIDELLIHEKIISLTSYKELLEKQLHRQLEKLFELDKEIKDVLKVYYFESKQLIMEGDPPKITPDELDEKSYQAKKLTKAVSKIYKNIVLNGAVSTRIKEELRSIWHNEFIPSHLKKATCDGVLSLVDKRESILEVAQTIIGKISPIESILESVILNDKLPSLDEYLKANMPIPFKVAEKFVNRKKNKRGKYSSSVIGEAMKYARDYFVKNNVTNLRGKKRTISKKIKERIVELSEADLKTIDKFVEYYAMKAGLDV